MSDAIDLPKESHVGPVVTARIPARLSRLYGVRLLFQPTSRERLARFAAGLSVLGFAARASFQIGGLGRSSLQYDYKPYYDAATSLNQGGDPYAAFLNACGPVWCHVGYIYPPLFAELFRPLALLTPHQGALIWLVLSYGFLAASIAVADRVVRGWLSATTRAMLLLAAMVFVPLYKNFYFLQVGALMLLILAAAAWSFTRRRDATTGGLLGLASVLRVTPLIQAPMLLRSRADLRRPSGVAGLVIAILAIVGTLALLTTTTFEYVSTVLPRLGLSTGILENLSLPGALVRASLLTGGPSQASLKYVGIVLQLVLLAVTWFYSLRLEGGRERAAVFAAFLAVTPIVSSITWDHHLVTELLVLALLAPSLRPGSRAWWLAVASYPLLWVPQGITERMVSLLGLDLPHGLAVAPFLLITGLNLLGMLLLWLACIDALGTHRAAVADLSTR
jgi:alpha-1,2-mannosyltransferase